MREKKRFKAGLPPDAKEEILEVLCTKMEISADEIVAILRKNIMLPPTRKFCRTAIVDSWARDSWPVFEMMPGAGRCWPQSVESMSSWNAAMIVSVSRLSAAVSKTR